MRHEPHYNPKIGTFTWRVDRDDTEIRELSAFRIKCAIRNAHIAYAYTVRHMPLRELAGRYRLSHTRIRKIVLALDGEMRPPGRPAKGLPRYG